MPEAYGFRERRVAEQLRDFAGRLGTDPQPGMKSPPRSAGVGQHRTYWIVPKDTIPAATDEKTPGIGKGYICRLNRDAEPPAIERYQVDGEDIEVDVFNYTLSAIEEDPEDELSPLMRVSEDVFGELAIFEMPQAGATLLLGQATTTAGIAPRTGVTPGFTSDGGRRVIVASNGLLYYTNDTFDVHSWLTEVQATTGDRLFWYSVVDGRNWIFKDDCRDTNAPTLPLFDPE